MEDLAWDMCSPRCQPPRKKKRQRRDASPQPGSSNPAPSVSQEGLPGSYMNAAQPAAIPADSGQQVPPSGGETYSFSNNNELSILVNPLSNIIDNFKWAQTSGALLQFKGAQSASSIHEVYTDKPLGAHVIRATLAAGDAAPQITLHNSFLGQNMQANRVWHGSTNIPVTANKDGFGLPINATPNFGIFFSN